MRVILGMIVGAALTVGVAYLRDTTIDGATPQKQLVNWDVAAAMASKASAFVSEQWHKLTTK